MVNRSRAEIEWVTHLCDVLGIGTTPDTVLKVLEDGAARDLFDAYIDLGSVHVYAEYDGGRYHDEDRCEHDLRKSKSVVDHDPLAVVLRARVQAAPLITTVARIIVVHVDHPRMHGLVYDTARALKPHVPDPYAGRLGRVQCHRRPVAEVAAAEVLKKLDRNVGRELDLLSANLGTDSAVRVSKVNGVKTLMEQGRFAVHALSFKTDFDLTTAQFAKIMSGCVAIRVENVAFRNALRSLKTDFGLTTAQFVKIMSDCVVAARIQDDAFLARLVTERDSSQKRLRDLCGEYRVVARRVV